MTAAERWARVDALLQDALELPPEQRTAFLRRASAGDDVLLHEVAELLEADRQAGAFLGGASACGEADAPRPAGTRIGAYRLLALLGRGGMSCVYLAERADGAFERRVALKVMEHGVFGADWRRRFQTERSILARLEHPWIARLLDGGTTDDGCPYLVMELVDGRPIDRYCREEKLSVGQRVALLTRVCEAVAWAHRNLIVHRDLKPGNVLVTAAGEPRLVDFGIAKLLEPGALAAEQTRSQLRLMSPAYASPEQIVGGTITTATDVWALGALAYEVLTGARPFGSPGSLAELEASRRREPEAPSRCAEAADGRERASRRRQLRGDLDTIVLKALRHEPERRYGTAEELGADFARYLQRLPVAARPDRLLYRAGKLVRRHAWPVGLAAASLLVIVSLAVGLAFQAARLRAERDKAREAVDLLAHVFRQAGGRQGGQQAVREVLRKGEPQLRRRLADQPRLLAVLLSAVGGVYHDLGLYADARKALEEAVRLATQAGETHELHSVLLGLGLLEQSVGALDRAEALYRQAFELSREEHGPAHPDTASVLAHLGALALFRHRPAEAVEPLRAATAILDRDARALQHHESNAFAHAYLGTAYRRLGRLNDAAASLQRALAIATEHETQPYLSVLRSDQALVDGARGRLAEAAAGFGLALAGLEAELGPNHPYTATVRLNLCRARAQLGAPAAARPDCRNAPGALAAALEDKPADTPLAPELLSQPPNVPGGPAGAP